MVKMQTSRARKQRNMLSLPDPSTAHGTLPLLPRHLLYHLRLQQAPLVPMLEFSLTTQITHHSTAVSTHLLRWGGVLAEILRFGYEMKLLAAPVTFSVLNQTKTLSTAFCCFLILDKPQSYLQVIALCLLVVSALVNQEILLLPCSKRPNVEEGDVEEAAENNSKTKPEDDERQLFMGVLPALSASFLSGLAGALTQKTLTHRARSPHLFNIELAFFSSCFLVSTLLLGSLDYIRIKGGGLWQGWTWKTLIPIMTSAFGGILVGLVIKHLGAVVKGFAVIFGMIVSGILQQLLLAHMGESVTWAQFISGCIGAASLWLHASYQPT